MAAHSRAEGVMGFALLPAVLVYGNVKIIIAEKQIILHGSAPSAAGLLQLYILMCLVVWLQEKKHILVYRRSYHHMYNIVKQWYD